MSGLGLFGMFFVGGLAGWIASLLPNQRRNLVSDIVIGVVGSIGGAVAARQVDAHIAPGMASSLLMSALGAVLLLTVFGLFRRRP